MSLQDILERSEQLEEWLVTFTGLIWGRIYRGSAGNAQPAKEEKGRNRQEHPDAPTDSGGTMEEDSY